MRQDASTLTRMPHTCDWPACRQEPARASRPRTHKKGLQHTGQGLPADQASPRHDSRPPHLPAPEAALDGVPSFHEPNDAFTHPFIQYLPAPEAALDGVHVVACAEQLQQCRHGGSTRGLAAPAETRGEKGSRR
jgi:hypothetical protein